MDETKDTNAAIWQSDEIVEHWVAGVDEREAKRTPQWRLMGELLPFDAHDAFTVLDLGAGTGAGAQPMDRYNGRFRYVGFDMVSDVWSEKVPAAVDAVVSSQCIYHLPDKTNQSLPVLLHRLNPVLRG